jgi:polyisoprenyl-phosphate glycosyltransferase
MNFVALVSHGLSAISVFGDIVGVRLLIGSLAGALLTGLGIFAVAIVRIFTNWAIPGWATFVTGLFGIILVQFITIATSFTFLVLSNWSNFGFLPLRDYALFVAETVELYSHE